MDARIQLSAFSIQLLSMIAKVFGSKKAAKLLGKTQRSP
jgi:hypothetical protein